MRIQRKIAILLLAAIAALGISTALAKPGPGDKQCIPGQQGNPHPAHKAGVCSNP